MPIVGQVSTWCDLVLNGSLEETRWIAFWFTPGERTASPAGSPVNRLTKPEWLCVPVCTELCTKHVCSEGGHACVQQFRWAVDGQEKPTWTYRKSLIYCTSVLKGMEAWWLPAVGAGRQHMAFLLPLAPLRGAQLPETHFISGRPCYHEK